MSAALAASVVGIAGQPALAASGSTTDIAQAMENRKNVEYGGADWRDFGTTRTFTRVELSAPDPRTPSLEYYNWDAQAWAPLWTAEQAFSGTKTVILDQPRQASKIRVVPDTVRITGVFNDSPISATTSVDITTTVGVPPTLPAHLNVKQGNGGRLLLPVSWQAVPQTRYEAPGGYTVTGTYSDGGVSGTATATIAVTKDKGLIELATPYMGWNHWYALRFDATAATFKAQVEAMEKSGLTDAGYDIIWIDEGWWGNTDNKTYRDADGNMVPGPKFGDPGALADWLHARGLKFGMYTDTGSGSCGGYFGSGGDNWFENYRKDVRQFKAWGVDAIKLDHCGGHNDAGPYTDTNAEVYAGFYQALRAEDPEGTIIFDTCEAGQEAPGDWAYKIANAWRTDGDLGVPALDDKFFEIWERNINRQASGPGEKGWNDPDYLTIDAPGNVMTPEQFRTYFTLWAISAAPLILSQDVTKLKPQNIATLTNKDMLAIDQDPLGVQPSLIRRDANGLQVWSKPLAAKNGKTRAAVTLLNRSSAPATFGFRWAEAGLKNVSKVHNVWENTDEPTGDDYQGVVFPGEVTVVVAEGEATDPAAGWPTINYAPQSLIVAPSGSNQFQRSQAAADYRTDTYWRPNFNDLDGSQWIQADFGRPLPVGEVDMVMQTNFTATSQVEYWDGKTWQVAATAASLSGTTVFQIDPPVTTTKVRWRAPGGGNPQVKEFEIYPPAKNNGSYANLSKPVATPNPNLAQRGDVQCFASSDRPNYGCDKLTDGIVQKGTDQAAVTGPGRWNSGVVGNNEYIGLTWGTPVQAGVDKTLRLFYGSWWHRETRSVVEYRASESDDWTRLAVVAATPAAGEVQAQDVMDFDLTGKTVKQVRVRFTEVVATTDGPWSGAAYPTFWEIELNTTAQGPVPLVTRITPVQTKAGRAPAMPTRVDARFSDGEWAKAPVTWDAIDPANYARAGEFFATGTVAGTTVPAKARVTVLKRLSTLEELGKLYDANKGRAKADYAAGGWPAFAEALAGAKRVLSADPAPGQSAIVAAGIALEDAVDALAYIRDLKELVADVGSLDAGDFLPGAWPAFAAALATARSVLANADATTVEVDEAYEELLTAADGLRVPNLAVAPRATASASSIYNSTYDAPKINDGDDTTRWNATSAQGNGGWARLDWAEPVAANWATIVLYQWSGRAELAHVQYLSGEEWKTLATFANNPTEGQYQSQDVVQLPLGNIEFSSLRVIYEKAVSAGGGPSPSIWEFEVYDWPVLSVQPVRLATTAGTAATLPATVPAKLANRQTAPAHVTWDPIPAEKWLVPGTFEATGTIPGTNLRATAEITVKPLTPATAPSITGTAEVTGLLTANPGTWKLDGLTFDYQWNMDGKPINGATSADLPVTATLAGKPVTVTVTATKTGHTLGSATSEPVTVRAVPVWNATKVYQEGDRVLYQNRLFEAQWWTQNQVPTSSPWLAWAEIGATIRCSTEATARTWTDSGIYLTGQTAVHDGIRWTAQWWTRNQEPGDKNGPWVKTDTCNG
ncbi:Ig-like domain-containing protein [Rhizomonospora bruguierae]|uniref:Ig-like domain-containing protein n=1 Tax=Rhizomonospora bruguierae TaxID=1581705 RepID=UPI001BCBEC97|nr:Ig-like domain-containing protein [Micromonospora sp. NBRC 107566]